MRAFRPIIQRVGASQRFTRGLKVVAAITAGAAMSVPLIVCEEKKGAKVFKASAALGEGLRKEVWCAKHQNVEVLDVDNDVVQMLLTTIRDAESNGSEFVNSCDRLFGLMFNEVSCNLEVDDEVITTPSGAQFEGPKLDYSTPCLAVTLILDDEPETSDSHTRSAANGWSADADIFTSAAKEILPQASRGYIRIGKGGKVIEAFLPPPPAEDKKKDEEGNGDKEKEGEGSAEGGDDKKAAGAEEDDEDDDEDDDGYSHVILLTPCMVDSSAVVAAIRHISKVMEVEKEDMMVASICASLDAVNTLTSQEKDVSIIVAAIDPLTNKKNQIIPGVGNLSSRYLAAREEGTNVVENASVALPVAAELSSPVVATPVAAAVVAAEATVVPPKKKGWLW